MKAFKVFSLLIALTFIVISCNDDSPEEQGDDLISFPYNPESYTLDLPPHFPQMFIPNDNPFTKQGITLGRHLFYDPILSADSSMSCASCHLPSLAFADGKSVSRGIDGIAGTRSSMSLINVGFVQSGLFWDGRAKTLEEQALLPVEDPIELHHTWPQVVEKLKKHPSYPRMFREAFGITSRDQITKELAAKAIAQFERIIISKDSKFDRVEQNKDIYTDQELMGYGIFFDIDPDLPDGECAHCHNTPLATSDAFFNNGLNESTTLEGFPDLGRGKISGSKADNGKFRATTLRNIRYSAPYMHDGRFSTFDQVLEHYLSGGKPSPNKDALIGDINKNKLKPVHIEALKAFINTFEDTLFFSNPELQNPFN